MKRIHCTVLLSLGIAFCIGCGDSSRQPWESKAQPSAKKKLKFEGMAADGKTPLFSMPFADPTNQIPLVNSFADNTSIISRWQMQLGIRYLFN